MLKQYHNPISGLVFLYAHTGLKEDNDNYVYSISSRIIRPDKSPLQFHSLVRYREFTGRDRYYSNLTKNEVEAAPSPQGVKYQIKSFLKNQSFAFAFSNNSNLLELQRFTGIERIINLSFVSEFFLQHLESHSLQRLWESLFNKKRKRVSFSAEEIVLLSVELVKNISGNELNDQMNPRARALRYYLKKSNTLLGEAFIHITKNHQRYFGDLLTPYSKEDTGDWKSFLEYADPLITISEDETLCRKIPEQEITSRFQEMSNSGKGFKFRPSQVEYAHHVSQALNKSSILCLEAGTGTGKTQGYLVPAMEFLRRNPSKRIVISTYTKSLQDQICHKEIKLTKDIFKIFRDVPVTVLKGKSSYICVEKLDNSFEDEFKGAELLAWMFLVNNVYNYKHADKDSIGGNIKKYLNTNNLLAHLLDTTSAKLGCSSKHSRCPAQIVIAKARNSRLIVTNHHKLSILDREPLLCDIFKDYIIDEANHFEQAIRGAFRTEVHSKEIYRSLQYLKKRIKSIVLQADKTERNTLYIKFQKILKRIKSLTANMQELTGTLDLINPRLKYFEEQIIDSNDAKILAEQINTHLHTVSDLIANICKKAEALLNDNTLTFKIVHVRTLRNMQAEISTLYNTSLDLRMLKSTLTSQNSVFSYCLFKKHFSLFATPVMIDEIIQNHIYEKKDSVIFTAATLCDNSSFSCFHEIIGVSEKGPYSTKTVESVSIPSPFSLDSMEVIIPEDSISGKYQNKKAWLRNIVPAISKLITDNKGRTLVLFASYDDLKHVADKIYEEITNQGFPLLVQKAGAPTINLCDEFRTVKESVLFGVDTFWYGVDFAGDTLTQVIITRQPNPSPRDPIHLAKRKLLPRAQYDEYYRYKRDMKLKQGIGRLIRSDKDKGKVAILDSRVDLVQLGLEESFATNEKPTQIEDKQHESNANRKQIDIEQPLLDKEIPEYVSTPIVDSDSTSDLIGSHKEIQEIESNQESISQPETDTSSKYSHALRILRVLSDGIDPFTGEILPNDSPYQNAHIIRALNNAIEALKIQARYERRRIEQPKNAGKSWTPDEDELLIQAFKEGKTILEIARAHRRTKGTIEKRLLSHGVNNLLQQAKENV